MSFITYGNVAVTVPPVKDTTPCMNEMLNYEDCVADADILQNEIIHPNWPTMWPRLLTDGHLIQIPEDLNITPSNFYEFKNFRALTKKNKQYLWECEEERFTFKSCLRKVISLKKTDKHKNWDTAEVSNLQFA